MAKVTFDGENLLIIVNAGITELDVQIDLYSDWKEWILLSDNSKYLQAFSGIGGEPIGGGLFVGTTYLLLNGWKIRPDEVNHTLTLLGNLFGDAGAEIVQPTVGSFIVAVQFRNSSLAQGVATGGGVGTPSQVADAVWDASLAAHVAANTFGSTNQVAGSGLSSSQVADAVWDEVLTGATHNITNSAGKKLRQAADTVAYSGTVNDAAASTTSFVIDSGASAVDGFYKDQTFVFTDGALDGQARIIATYTGTSRTVTLDEALTSAPVNGVGIQIIADHIHPITQIAAAVWDAALGSHIASGSFGEAVGANIKIDSATAVSLATTLLKYQRNRTRIDTTAKTLTIYDDDDLTPITIFDLKDTGGSPSITEISERLPQ